MNLDSKYMSKDYIPLRFASSFEEYETSSLDISVVGSLHKHANAWVTMGAPPFVLDIVQNGYTIPFQSVPKARYLRNNYSSRSRPVFVRRAIDELVQTRAVSELPHRPTVVNPLTVAAKGDKLRLVLDLSHINRHVFRQPCKIEGPETLAKYLPGANWLFGFDLKSGYHHVDIVPRHRPYLGFAYNDHQGRVRYFMFNVMPFGLAPAGFVFTKLLRVLIKLWRSNSIRIVTFFDDGISADCGYEEAVANSNTVKQDLLLAGYIPNARKSSWDPVAIFTWLGFIYNLISGYIFAEKRKLDNLVALLVCTKARRRVPVKILAKITGSLSALHLAFGDVVYLKAKYIQIIISKSNDWNRHVNISPEARSEMVFWINYLHRENGMPVSNPIASGSVSYSDASGVACAALITPMPGKRTVIVNRPFSKEESLNSSTYRELLAVFMGIHEAKLLLRNQAIRWFTDSQCVVSIVRKGSMKKHLLNMALQIFYITRRYNIALSVTWISRDFNERADQASRIIDHDDWGVTPKWFRFISGRLIKSHINRFADHANTKLPRFNSRFYSPQCEAVDGHTSTVLIYYAHTYVAIASEASYLHGSSFLTYRNYGFSHLG